MKSIKKDTIIGRPAAHSQVRVLGSYSSNNKLAIMKKVLSYILSAIVSEPEKIDINQHEENGIINLTITVGKDEMGRVIGKNGKIIRAIRNVMKIKAIKENKKINITLAESPS